MEVRQKVSEAAIKRVLDGTWVDPSRFQRPVLYSRGEVSIWMRSSWEVDFAKELDRHDVRWVFEPARFNLGWTTYLPDFHLPDHGLYVEVKGFLKEESAQKMIDFQKLGHHLVLVTYHRSIEKLVNPVPEQIRLILGRQIEDFCIELTQKET